jgi:hypothetical protein
VEVKSKTRQNVLMSQLIAVCAIVGAVLGILNFFRAYLSETERLTISLWESDSEHPAVEVINHSHFPITVVELGSSRRSTALQVPYCSDEDSRHNSGANCRHQTPIDVPENPYCNPAQNHVLSHISMWCA